MRFSTILSAFLVLAVFGCAGEKAAPTGKAEPAPVATKAEPEPAPTPKEPVAPPSEFQALRDTIRSIADTHNRCDVRWFARVDPSRIDSYERPVDVDGMEDDCSGMVALFEKALEQGAFRNPALDSWLRETAGIVDRYVLLVFRARKIMVKDKLPYKKEMTELRDAVRADSKVLAESVGPLLALSDDDLKALHKASSDVLVREAHRALASVGGDVRKWIEEPVDQGSAVWRHSIKASAVMARRAAEALALTRADAPKPLVEASAKLSKAFDEAVAFFTGRHFDEETPKVKAARQAIRKAIKAYEAVAKRTVRGP
jgi:hypothetical protein